MDRRQYLALTGAVATTALAGCAEDSSSDTDTGSNGGGDSDGGSNEDGGSGDSSGGEQATTTSEGSGGEDQPAVALVEHDTYEEEFQQGVRGIAQNTTDSEIDYAEIKVVFLDGEGVQVGDSLDNTTELTAGRKFEFDCIFLGDDWSAVSEYEIETSDSPF